MRILQNIYNEFVIYKKTLRTSQDLSLSDEQMLAMIVFKNLYPSDFADIQDEKGILKKAFEEKDNFIIKQKHLIQEQIDHYTDVINGAQEDTLKSVRELKYAMVITFIGKFCEFKGFGNGWYTQLLASTFLSDNFEMEELKRNNYTYIFLIGMNEMK